MTIDDALPMTAMLAELANVRAELERTKRRLESEREERCRAFAQNVPGPRHATTVDPQAERPPQQPPSPSVPTLAELDALAEAFDSATCARAEDEALRVHAAACKRAGIDDRVHFNDWIKNRSKPKQKPQTIDEAERDRRVGAAVMAAYHYDADSLLHCAAFLETNGYDTAVPVLRAIAAALREEEGR